MKGFVITIDALMALSFLFLAVLLLSSNSFQPNAPRGIYLKQLTLDALTVMDKVGAFDNAVDGDANPVNQILASTPHSACMQITIIDRNGDDVATLSKIGCGEFGRELQSASKPFVHNGKPYMVKTKSWYRKELS